LAAALAGARMSTATGSAAKMPWAVVIASAALMAITTGARQSLGLFVRPLAATGLGIATVSLVLAVGQFWWGASQPVFGILADRIGSYRVIVLGALLLAGGLAAAPLVTTAGGLFATLGILSAIGGGAASYAIIIGAVARRVPVLHQALASSLVNAGASLGQFVFAPLTQAVIALAGWPVAMWTLAGAALVTIAVARPAVGAEAPHLAADAAELRSPLLDLIRPAFGNRSYWYLHLGFFTCGFHIAFLVTHLPGEVALCGLAPAAAGFAIGVIGLANIVGTVAIGWSASRYRMKMLLVGVYSARVAAIAIYLLAPKTLVTLYTFSAVLGLTWLATVPLTAGLVGKLFGARHLATLFGLTLLSHQTGGFFGAWLGGLALSLTGSYQWVWCLDMGLAAVAALAHLPIREPPLAPRPAAAAVAA
jgi:MFS family permease